MFRFFGFSAVLALLVFLGGSKGQAADAEKTKDYPQELKAPPLARDEVKKQEISPQSGKSGAVVELNAASASSRRGILRDAGKFKVELRTRNRGIDVFLLNSQEGSPVIDASDIEGQLYVGDKEYELRFRAQPGQAKFFAPWPEKLRLEEDLQGKEIAVVLLPTRERIIGAPVLYKLERFF